MIGGGKAADQRTNASTDWAPAASFEQTKLNEPQCKFSSHLSIPLNTIWYSKRSRKTLL